PGQIDAAIADHALGDASRRTEFRQRSRQHQLTQIEHHARAAQLDPRGLEPGSDSPGTHVSLNVVEAELLIDPLTIDEDVVSRNPGEAQLGDADAPGYRRRGHRTFHLSGDLRLAVQPIDATDCLRHGADGDLTLRAQRKLAAGDPWTPHLAADLHRFS